MYLELVLVFPCYPFDVCKACNAVSPFIPGTGDLCLLSVFLSLARDLSIY